MNPSRSLFLEFRRVTRFFTAVRLFPVYFGLASRPIFAVRDCVTLESCLRFPPHPSHAWASRAGVAVRGLHRDALEETSQECVMIKRLSKNNRQSSTCGLQRTRGIRNPFVRRYNIARVHCNQEVRTNALRPLDGFRKVSVKVPQAEHTNVDVPTPSGWPS